MNNRLIVTVLFALALLMSVADASAGEAGSAPDVLMTGTFSWFDIEAAAGEKWYGVYNKKDGYHLVRTSIRVERSAAAGGETRGGGKVVVSAEAEGVPLFLVKGIEGLKEGPLATCFAGNSVISAGKAEEIKCGGKDPYTLSATGVRGEDGKLYGYDLTLMRGKLEQDMGAEDTCESAGVTLYWAGDIDEDKELDLLIDMSCDGVTHDYTLFLSSYAMGEGLVDDAAEFDTMYE